MSGCCGNDCDPCYLEPANGEEEPLPIGSMRLRDGKTLQEFGVYLFRTTPLRVEPDFVERWFTYFLTGDGVEVEPGTVRSGISDDGLDRVVWVYAHGWATYTRSG